MVCAGAEVVVQGIVMALVHVPGFSVHSAEGCQILGMVVLLHGFAPLSTSNGSHGDVMG